ncbi:ComF family protein [Oceanobacillus salinisoli]|uniref:ComF family protein n=1 Tax=Oceanobacillus salinisoli TaxID=2678611 RepID=UPI0012E1E3D6|nr:ComF family protein [Oceanobacillus salinisoli]
MDCAWCQSEIIPQSSWSNLFLLDKPALLCPDCEGELEWIHGNRCIRCSRTTPDTQCSDCLWWEKQGGRDSIQFNFSVFTYNSIMQAIITKWKYRGDYYLGNVFKEYFITAFYEKFAFLKKDAIVVPIPLSEERLMERCFNQAKMLAEFLPLDSKEVISRKDGEKQSKKTRKERIFSENPFFITEPINKSVILVDDIYTTGTTLRHTAKLLEEHGCPNVYTMTLVRG